MNFKWMVRYCVCVFKSLQLQGVFLQTTELQISPTRDLS